MSNLNNRFLRKGSAPARLVDSSIPVRDYDTTKTVKDNVLKKHDKDSQHDSRDPPNSIFRSTSAAYRDDRSSHFNNRMNDISNTKFSFKRKGSEPARLVHPSVPVGDVQRQDWMVCSDFISPQRNECRDLEGEIAFCIEEAKAKLKTLAKTEPIGKVDIGTGLRKEKSTPARNAFSLKLLSMFFLHLPIVLFVAGTVLHFYHSPFFTTLPWVLPLKSKEIIAGSGDNVKEVADSPKVDKPSSNILSETDPDRIEQELSSKAKQASDLEIEIAWESQHVHEMEESLGENIANHGMFSVHELNKQNRALGDRVHHLMEMEKEKELEEEGGHGLRSDPDTDSAEPIEQEVLSSKPKQASDLEIEIAWESQHVHQIEESLGEKFSNHGMFSAHELAKQNRALGDRVHHLMEMEKELGKEGGHGLRSLNVLQQQK